MVEYQRAVFVVSAEGGNLPGRRPALQKGGGRRDACATGSTFSGGLFHGQGDADDAGGRGDDLEFAVVVLDDFLGDGEAEAEADAAGGVKGGGNSFGGIGAEAGAVVLDLDGQSPTPSVWNFTPICGDLGLAWRALSMISESAWRRAARSPVTMKGRLLFSILSCAPAAGCWRMASW